MFHVCPEKSIEAHFERMSTARIVMKNAKKKAAVYSVKAKAAKRIIFTARILDIEKVSRASQRPTILTMQTACPVRHIGRKITTAHVTHPRAQSTKRLLDVVELAAGCSISGRISERGDETRSGTFCNLKKYHTKKHMAIAQVAQRI